MRSPLTRAIQDNTKKTVDSVNLKAADDNWRQTNLMSKDVRAKFVQEFTDLGFSNMQPYIYGELNLWAPRRHWEFPCYLFTRY
jgi:hypothetical protein